MTHFQVHVRSYCVLHYQYTVSANRELRHTSICSIFPLTVFLPRFVRKKKKRKKKEMHLHLIAARRQPFENNANIKELIKLHKSRAEELL